MTRRTLVSVLSLLMAFGAVAAEVADEFVTAARQLYLTDEYADCKKEAVSLYYKGVDKLGWTNDYPSASGNDIVTWYRVGGTVRNVRDIGGWTGLRSGRVYRGTQLSVCKKDQNHYIDESGKDFMLNTLHIKTDLDFRHESEAGRGEYVYTSPLGPTVELVGAVIQSYTNIFVAGYKPALQKMMRTFADSTKYPIYMHCMGGADRTGSAAFILEGLCGVSEPDLRIDYELTSFSGQGSRKSYDPSEENWFQQMYAMMKAYPGSTWSEKIESYCKTFLELTDVEIASIRANLMSTPGRSFVYTEDTTVTEALVLDDDVLIDVYPGVTVTYSGEVSGSGRLFKVGEGTLVLGGVNSFTGSLEAEKGTVRLTTPLSAATKVVLGKGRVVCGSASALGSAKVVWTAPEGTLDVNGYATTVLLGADSTPELAKGATGYEVINSTTKSPDVTVTTEAERTSVYVRFSGKMTLMPSTKNMVLKNRRHDITEFSMGATMTIGEGTVIRGVTSYTGSSGARTLTISSEERECFADLKSIAIGKSRINFTSRAILSEFSRRGDIALAVVSGKAADAGLVLPTADSRLVVKSLTDGSGNVITGVGCYLASDYFKLNSGAYSSGWVVIDAGRTPTTSETVTWAGAADADLSAAPNWTDSQSRPLSETVDLADPVGYFAANISSGSSAGLSKTVYFSEFNFGGSLNGFAVGSEGNAGCLRIDGAGITFAEKTDPSTERTFEFFCPVILNSSAALTIPAGDRLIFHNGASINADGLTLDGSGTLEFVGGVNYIEGDITMTDGSIAASGAVTGGGSIAIPTGTRTIWLNGADFDVPVTVTEAVNLAFDTISDVGTTNVIRHFETEKTSQIFFREDHVFVIDGLDAYSKITFTALGGSGKGATVIVRDVTQGNRSDGLFAVQYSTKLILDSSETGNGRKLMINKAGGRIEFARDNWFSAATAAMATAGAFESDAAGRYSLGGTHQFCSYIEGEAAIDGAAGSVVEIACGTDATHSGVIGGAASIVMNGAGRQTFSGVSTSSGGLTVKQGELVLSSAASWNNASAVKVLGGKLTLGGAKQFNAEETELIVEGDGVIDVSDKVRFAIASVDGVKIESGKFTTAKPGPFAGHIDGSGSIIIGKRGLVLVVY